jgi:hypothetical protein
MSKKIEVLSREVRLTSDERTPQLPEGKKGK